jgi:predicted lipoprotein with Yx(FWY)xxD motif
MRRSIMKKSALYGFALSATITVALAGCATVPSASSAPAASHGAAAPYGAASAPKPASPALTVGMTSLGSALAAKGRTLYLFDADKPNSGRSACTGDCLNDWPPVLVTGATPKIMGVTGTLGSIRAADGGKQLTIDGRPLYTFAGDRASGDVNGQAVNEFGAHWWVAAPTGAKITGR